MISESQSHSVAQPESMMMLPHLRPAKLAHIGVTRIVPFHRLKLLDYVHFFRKTRQDASTKRGIPKNCALKIGGFFGDKPSPTICLVASAEPHLCCACDSLEAR